MQLRPDRLKLGLIQRRDRSGIIRHFTYDDEQRVKEIRFEGNSEFRKIEYRYDPVTGRYTQMDQIGLAGGINTYSYVDDPLTWVDGSVGWKGCVVLEGDGTTHDIVLILTKKYKEALGHIEDVINQKNKDIIYYKPFGNKDNQK